MIDSNSLHIVALSDQEIMNLRRLTFDPAFATVLKLLEGEAQRATAEAINNSDPNKEHRLTLLDDARATHRVVGNLIKQLNNYRAIPDAGASMPVIPDPMDFDFGVEQ